MESATADQEGERPGQVPEAVDEAQRGGEADLEQAAEDEERPRHAKGLAPAARAALASRAWPDRSATRSRPPRFIVFIAAARARRSPAATYRSCHDPGARRAWLGFDARRPRVPARLPAAAADRRSRGRSATMPTANDANRTMLLVITGVVMARGAGRGRAETMRRRPQAGQDQGADHRAPCCSPGCSATRSTRCIMPISPIARAGRAAGIDFPGDDEPAYCGLRLFRLHARHDLPDLGRRRSATPASGAW